MYLTNDVLLLFVNFQVHDWVRGNENPNQRVVESTTEKAVGVLYGA